ncbi:hypothetical protein FJTKL_06333 [Diaporthe vaccinii]|uniref:C2H2-type domain-containing protein n=1 Tax=Diaporthe vaccinii TaxID=105482 RepID=A0ABR4DQE6_9PEZI
MPLVSTSCVPQDTWYPRPSLLNHHCPEHRHSHVDRALTPIHASPHSGHASSHKMPKTAESDATDWTSDPESESQSEYHDSGSDSDDVSDFQEAIPEEPSSSGLDDLDSDEDDDTVFPEFDPSEVERLQRQGAPDDDSEIARQIEQFGLDNPVREHSPGSDSDGWYDGNRAPPEFYQQSMQQFDENHFKRKHYSKGTLKLIANCENYWLSFCTKVLHKHDWVQCIVGLNFMVVYHFLWWYLNQKTGKKGQRKRPVSKLSSLITFWCCFRLFYERHTTKKIDDVLPRGVIHNALIDLSTKFGLGRDKRENRSMTLDDLKLHIETTLRTTNKDFKLGELRILAVLFLLLLAPQGSRPQSILNVRFRHIDVLLIRDPDNRRGPPRLTIRLRLEGTKTYRGSKAVKTFLVPEIIYDPSLLLSPHVFLLAILIHNRAFKTDRLNEEPHRISTLRIHPDANELRLVLRDDIKDMPLFRRSIKTITGYEMSSTAAITQAMTGKWIQSVGKLLGFEHNTIAYNLRYFAGNSLDQSVNVSSALRDLIMDHAPNSETFQRHYLNRNVCADLWAIHRNQNPQTALITQATSHGGSRDSRRVITLSEDQINQVRRDPRYQQLSAEIEGLVKSGARRSSTARKDLTRKRKNLFDKLKARKLQEVKRQWTELQALQDIERQLQGQDFSAVMHKPMESPMNDVQRRMFESLTAPLEGDLEAQFRRRTRAIEALVAYCGEEEPLRTQVTEARRPPPPPEVSAQHLSPKEQLRQIHESVLVKLMGNRIRRCFLCTTRACSLGPSHSRFDELCREFYDEHVLARHFSSVHLDEIAQDQGFVCPHPDCLVPLDDKDHLRLHAHMVHGISTDRKRKMRHNSGASTKKTKVT